MERGAYSSKDGKSVIVDGGGAVRRCDYCGKHKTRYRVAIRYVFGQQQHVVRCFECERDSWMRFVKREQAGFSADEVI